MRLLFLTEKKTKQEQVWNGDSDYQEFTPGHEKSELQIRHLVKI